MRILITGSDGYIGSVLAPHLARAGHDVHGVDAGLYSEGVLFEAGAPPRTRWQDVRTLDVGDLRGFEAVVHLAELSNDPLGAFDEALTHRINHRATVRLARLAREAGVRRFVQASSCSVYGLGASSLRTEDSPVDPRTAYARCKVLVEEDLGAMADARFSPIFLRNATVYGPSPRIRFDVVLNRLAGMAWTTGRVALRSDGTPWRPLVHVRDVAEAVRRVLEAPLEAVGGQVFNVGATDQNHRVSDVADVVAGVFGAGPVALGPGDPDGRSYRVSFEKIRERLPGFRCRHTPEDGARELERLFRGIGLTAARFRFRAFIRLKQLEHLVRTGQVDGDLFWTGKGAGGIMGDDRRLSAAG